MRRLSPRPLMASLAAIAFSWPVTAARAQQPLPVFLEAAETAALDAREARAVVRQAGAQVDAARARLLPALVAQGAYTRNQYDAAITNPATGEQLVIQPFDLFTVSVQLSVPLIDIGAWSGFFQSEALAEAARAQLEGTDLTVAAGVVQIWHQLVGARAMVEAAEQNLAAVERNVEAAEARVEVGVAAPLEASRARAEVARAQQALAEARLQATLAARNLENLTGVTPNERPQTLEADLDDEADPLARFLSTASNRPAVRAARAQLRAADIASDTAWTGFLPTISASAVESGSNVGGFTGQNFAYAIGVTATWQLDFARPAQIEAAAAAADIAAVRAERVEQQIETGIFEAWQRVRASRASARAAQAAVEATRRAVEDVRATFEAGAATQLDLIQAERDLFQSEVALIQALANLRVARMVLRIQAGMPFDE